MDSNISKFLGGTIQKRANNFRIRTQSSQHSATAVNSGTQKSNIRKEIVIDWKAGFNLVQEESSDPIRCIFQQMFKYCRGIAGNLGLK